MNEFAPTNKMMVTAVIIFLTGAALTALGFLNDISALGVLGAGIFGASVVLIFRLVRARHNEAFAKKIVIDQKDERQLKIYVHAGNFAFWVGMLAIIALAIMTRTKDPVVLFTPVVLLMTYLAAALYYSRRF